MSPDATPAGQRHDEASTSSRGTETEAKPTSRVGSLTFPAWQMLLALGLILVAVAGLCQVSGLSDRFRTLPAPTGTPTAPPTLTQVPTVAPTATVQPTATATPVPIVVTGGEAMVSGTGASELRLRSAPGLNQETLGTLEDGTHLTVLEGPESVDGYEWWKVRADDGRQGWVASEWLVPVVP
jgi:hypothetical protein